MKGNRKNAIISLVFVLIFVAILTSCNNDKKNDFKEIDDIEPEKSIILKDITLIEYKEDNDILYSIDGFDIAQISKLQNVSQVSHSMHSGRSAILFNDFLGTELKKNSLKIYGENKNIIINNYFSIMDIKISPEGRRIGFRAFVEDAYDSAQGLIIYNIDEKKTEKLESEIIISGDNYAWKSENEIIYYGVDPNDVRSNSIYIYDLNNNQEKKIFTIDKGFCQNIIPLKDGKLLFLIDTANDEGVELYILNQNGNCDKIKSNLSEIYDVIIDKKNNLAYFLGDDNSKIFLYKFDINNLTINKISYDYPKVISYNRGLAVNEFGMVYFCGLEEVSSSLYNVYMYDVNDDSINMVTDKQGEYYLVTNN